MNTLKNKVVLRGLFSAALIAGLGFSSFAQAQKDNWHNLDFKKDSVFGVSTEKAYLELLKGKKINTSYCRCTGWWS